MTTLTRSPLAPLLVAGALCFVSPARAQTLSYPDWPVCAIASEKTRAIYVVSGISPHMCSLLKRDPDWVASSEKGNGDAQCDPVGYDRCVAADSAGESKAIYPKGGSHD